MLEVPLYLKKIFIFSTTHLIIVFTPKTLDSLIDLVNQSFSIKLQLISLK